MPQQAFSYLGIDRWGRNVAGRMTAEDEANLEEKLHAMGLWLVEAKTDSVLDRRAKAGKSFGGIGGGARRREMINFCTLMSFQLKAGIPMVTALQVASEDCENQQFRLLLQEMKRNVEGGLQLCEVMERAPKVFTRQFISLVRAGESSSTLPETFLEQKRFLEWQEQIISDVRQATLYPTIVLIVVVAFVLVLFTFVVPKFMALLKAVNVSLPWPTLVVFGISNFLKATWWVWAALITVVPLGIHVARRYSESFAVKFDRFKFNLPVFGALNHLLAMSQFAHNLAVLYRSGVIITEALKLCEGLVKSAWLAKVTSELVTAVEAGSSLSESMRKYDIFPSLLVRMTTMGENTGSLDQALDNVADYYNLIIPRRIKKIFTIIEPVLILFLVGVVGMVAMAVFLPILSVADSLRK